MSDLQKAIEETVINVTFEDLDLVPYHNLKEKFAELGVEDAYKPGVKKVKMIRKAIKSLKEVEYARLQAVKENGEDEIEESDVKTIVEENKSIEAIEVIDAADQKKAEYEKRISDLVNSKISNEDIQININKCNSNIKSATAQAKVILLKNMGVLEAALEIREKNDK